MFDMEALKFSIVGGIRNLKITSLLLVLLLICLTGTDAQTSSEEKQCPYYWRKFNNRCFFMPSPAAQALETRRGAISECEAYGAQLVKILSSEENIFIRRILNSFNPTWVGGGGGKGDPDEFLEWIDGTPVNFTNFKDPDDPYDRRSQEREPEVKCTADCCGLTVDKNGDWRFKSCDTVLEYVCEIDLGRPLLKSVEDPGFIAPIRPTQPPSQESEQSQSVEVNHPPHPHQHNHHIHVDNKPDPVEVTEPPAPSQSQPQPQPPPPPVTNVDTAVRGEQRESKQIDEVAEQQNPAKPATPSTTTAKPSTNSGLSTCTIGFHFYHILPLFIILLVLKILE